MAMQKRSYQAIDGEGTTIPSPLIDVFVSGTATRADLFSDDLISPTPLANPFTGDSEGRFGFFTPDGLVDIVVNSAYTIASEQFDYTLADTPLDSAVESINGQTEALQAIVLGTAGVNAAIVSAAGIHTINLPTASGAARGLLSPVHWTLFNSAIRTLAGLSGNTITITIGSAGNDANLAPLGTNIAINLPTASATKRGLLSSANWSTFNGKQAAFAGTVLQYVRGDASLATLNTAIVPEVTNLYFTTARARTALAAPTAPLTYNSGTGVFAIPVATAGVNGYLAATDWVIFNAKLGTVAPSITKDSDTLKVDGTRYTRTSVTTVDTTLTETTLSTITLGGAPSVGRTYRIRAGGDVRVGTGGTDTVRYRVYLGGVVVWDSGALDLTDVTALPYQLDVDVTVRTAGGSGVSQAVGKLMIVDSVFVPVIKSTNTTSVVLTGTPILKTTIQFSVSDATNIINEQSTVISTLG